MGKREKPVVSCDSDKDEDLRDKYVALQEEFTTFQQSVREREQRITAFIGALPDLGFILDEDGRYIEVLTGAPELLIYEPSKIRNQTVRDIFPEEQAETFIAVIKRTLESNSLQIIEYHLEVPAGKRWFEARLTPVKLPEGKPTMVVCLARDVTDRKRLEDKYHKYEFIANTSKHTMTLISRDFVYEAVNAQFCVSHKKKREEILGQSVADVWGKTTFETYIKPHLVACFRGEAVEQYQAEIEFPALGPRYFDVSCNPYRNPEGEVTHAVIVSRDISKRKQLEDELHKIQRLESIGVLAGGIAHDFNNFLTGMMGNISLAKIKIVDNDDVVEILSRAETASLRARGLTKQLLTFSKGGAPLKQAVSIMELIDELTSFILSGSKSTFRAEHVSNLWSVQCDEGQICQVLQNLIINADQSMPEGGIITIRTENKIVDESEMSALAAGNYIHISVTDEGVGISTQQLEKIFDPFYTTKEKGRGLGLAVVYSIVRGHDGHITVESYPNAGTTFHIYLPADLSARKLSHKKGDVAESTKAGRILVMDDEDCVRDVAVAILDNLGYEVNAVKDGVEAIRTYKDARKAGKPYDLVILDLTIPGGMGGKAALANLRTFDPDVKAIVSSGYADDPVFSEFREHGFAASVPKPYLANELTKTVDRIISGSE